MNLVELRSVGKTYNSRMEPVRALHDITMDVADGEFVAIWGPSGSGKSTLCNLIGLLDVPSDGRLSCVGRMAAELSDDQRSELRNERIGFVFQQFNLIPVLSAVENVMLPLQIRGVPYAQCRERAAAHLDRVGLGSHLDRRPDQLSGGQKQRVAVARALVGDPQLVLADEPTANLDTHTAYAIIDLMRALNQEQQTTFVFCTHDQRLLDSVERRIQLVDGTIAEDTRG
ncbi:MAG: ABC transporter ATP-binding protein [Nevskiales bacterium]|nr:ABC transporter ATP-binding protein [Nevskiales bacterium]